MMNLKKNSCSLLSDQYGFLLYVKEYYDASNGI